MASSGEYDLIICVGAEQVDALTNVATTYPDQKFALLDANSDLDNVASYSCKEQEGAFLAGALAVLAKQEKIDDKLNDGKVIGFIGVNLNQNEIAPDYIMASMLKKLDSCAYHAITSVVEGTYTGENQVLGLSDGGVDVTTEKSNIQVSDSIKEQLDDLKAKVISGEIEVPYELK